MLSCGLVLTQPDTPSVRCLHLVGDLRNNKSRLIEHEYLSRPSQAEIGHTALHFDLKNHLACRVPRADAITATAEDVSSSITLDTIWSTAIGHGEESFVCEERGSVENLDRECVAGHSVR